VIVATWNVNGIRARFPRLLEWLEERKPDVACLQELKIEEESFPHLELRAAGYHAVLLGQTGWNGVAVIARDKPEPGVRGLPGAESNGARLVTARVHGLEITSVYVPNGKTASHPDFRMKLAWLERLCEHVEARQDREAPVIVAGDYNVCPADIDSWAPEAMRDRIFHTVEERRLIARLMEAGLADLFRVVHPDDPGFSWWDYRAGSFHKKQGLRIDLLLGSASVVSRVVDVTVDREFRKKSKAGSVPSDHAPVYATLS
jgi:exodeoxyribonuclease III